SGAQFTEKSDVEWVKLCVGFYGSSVVMKKRRRQQRRMSAEADIAEEQRLDNVLKRAIQQQLANVTISPDGFVVLRIPLAVCKQLAEVNSRNEKRRQSN